MNKFEIEKIRKQIIGNDILIKTPFGKRHMLYLDYTASGRGVKIIEEKIQDILKSYSNTHTEDDYSGKFLTSLFTDAEKKIKKYVNAGENGRIVLVGSGATGALKKLQEIIGVYIPPLTKERFYNSISTFENKKKDIVKNIEKNKPVVFIGPYEHHTNELMWRESFAEVIVIKINEAGGIDLNDLEKNVSNIVYKNRKKFASFSAGSNVTGIMTDVYKIAEVCHKYDTLIFYDFAAIAPYSTLDMNKDKKSYFDAIFFSPHKFLGGPGSCGVLVFNNKIYRKDLPPTTSGGGTVLYVGFEDHDYIDDIEYREKAGTPPILQGIKAALVLELKEKIGIDNIKKIEKNYAEYFINQIKKIDNIECIDDISISKRLPIIPFNIKYKNKILHPKFVARLFNDLFGIQCRAGCNCAGPYGHILLNIDKNKSKKIRDYILKGCSGIRPGWVRINIHYTLNKYDIDYIIETLKFISSYGYLFLSKYEFDIKTAEWKHKDFKEKLPNLSFEYDYNLEKIDLSNLNKQREFYLSEANRIAKILEKDFKESFVRDSDEIEELKYFHSVDKIIEN
jgi:selenocysteine lyase/cysteine desulfurase